MTGRLSPSGNLRVEAWTAAPEDGYEESVELGMTRDEDQWTSNRQRDYFVKLPDGRFARVNFRMIAGGNHYFILESFLNPKPGSRNLEYDPNQSAPAP